MSPRAGGAKLSSVAPEFDHLADALDDDAGPIVQELRARLGAAPSDKDWLAITTAIAKATVAGLRRGAEECSEQIEEVLPEGRHISWDLDLDCTDLWEQRYGESAARTR